MCNSIFFKYVIKYFVIYVDNTEYIQTEPVFETLRSLPLILEAVQWTKLKND
jgi:hypothetical protein